MAEDGALTADVRAFVSTMGFGGGGGGDFSEFDPKMAKKKVSKPEPRAQAYAPSEAARRTGVFAPGSLGKAATPAGRGGRGAKSIRPPQEPALWWEAATHHGAPPATPPTGKPAPSPTLVVQLREAALAVLAREEAASETAMARRRGPDMAWLHSVRRTGTTADRVAAAALLVRDSACGALPALDSLLELSSKKGGTRAAVMPATDALAELFEEHLLPERKLLYFEQQDLAGLDEAVRVAHEREQTSAKKEADKEGSLPAQRSMTQSRRRDLVLLYWALEDGIKKRYARFVELLEESTRDGLDVVKQGALRAVARLLAARPEQEQALLSALVNKLGDPDRRLASKGGFLLSRLLNQHPAMKGVVVREIERLLFRPNLQERARYYGVITLNQMVLSERDSGGAELASRLIDLYFTLFSLVVGGLVGTRARRQKDAEQKKADKGKKKKEEDDVDKNGAKPTHAAAAAAPQLLSDASGQAMDARMLSALLTGVRRAFPFVPDARAEDLVASHADALFALTHTRSLGVATQALMLLHALLSRRGVASDRFFRALYDVLASPELPRSAHAPAFLALLVSALREDASAARVQAFAKRLLQVAMGASAHFACGCLMLVSALAKAHPSLWMAVSQPQDSGLEAGAEEKREGGEAGTEAKAEQADGRRASDALPKSRSASSLGSEHPYDPSKRDPMHAGAGGSCLWELCVLATHAHPSVVAMASALRAGTHVVYAGDPLKDLTVAAFLDKFVTKKSKKTGLQRGDSRMQPDRGSALARLTGALDLADELDDAAEPNAAFVQAYHALRAVREKKERRREATKSRVEAAAEESEGEGVEDVDSDASEDEGVAELVDEEERMGHFGPGADADTDLNYDELACAMADSEEEEELAREIAVARGQGSDGEEESDEGDDDDLDDDLDSEEELGASRKSRFPTREEDPDGIFLHSDEEEEESGEDPEAEGDEEEGENVFDSDASDAKEPWNFEASDAESSDVDDDEADAEVAELLKNPRLSKWRPEDEADVDPFVLAEGGDDDAVAEPVGRVKGKKKKSKEPEPAADSDTYLDQDSEGEAPARRKRGRDEEWEKVKQAVRAKLKPKKGGRRKELDVFASADDFEQFM